MFPILQSPPDVAQIFWTCQLHTAWQLLHDNDGSEHPAVSWWVDYFKMATEDHQKAALAVLRYGLGLNKQVGT